MYDFEFESQLGQVGFYPSQTPFEYIQIWLSKDGGEPVVERGDLSESKVEEWLSEDIESTKAKHGYCGGLRLLLHQGPKVFSEAKLGNTTMGLRKETFVNITTRLNLHPSYMRAISQDIGLYRAFDINAECTGYVVKPPSGTVEFANGAYTHNSSNGIICGFFRYNIAHFAEIFVGILEKSATSAADPLLPALAFAEWQAEKLCDQRLRLSNLLLKVERETGHTVVRDRPQYSINRNGLPMLTQSLGVINYQIVYAEVFASSLQLLCDLLKSSLQEKVPLGTCKEFQDRLDCALSSYKHSALMFSMYGKRASFLLSTVYNLIAQNDSNSNISIARDSKAIALASQHDSASMKTIAVLTTAFLPGTWVAAFFAIPLFNWSAGSGEQVLNGRFWVYWAVTLPLTAIVMGTWWAWMIWRQRRDRNEKRSGMAGLGGVNWDEKDFQSDTIISWSSTKRKRGDPSKTTAFPLQSANGTQQGAILRTSGAVGRRIDLPLTQGC